MRERRWPGSELATARCRPPQHTGAVGGALASHFAYAPTLDFMLFNTDMLRQYELIAQEVRARPGLACRRLALGGRLWVRCCRRGATHAGRWAAGVSELRRATQAIWVAHHVARSPCLAPRRPAAGIAWWRPDSQSVNSSCWEPCVGQSWCPCLRRTLAPGRRPPDHTAEAPNYRFCAALC